MLRFALVVLLGLIGCEPAIPSGPEPPPAAYHLEVTQQPFSYRLVASTTADAPALVEEAPADTAAASLYFVTDDGPQYLAKPMAFDATETELQATYRSTDGRTVHLYMAQQPEGGYRMEVRVEPDTGILRVGETLAARPGEGFHGLTERVIGPTDDDAPWSVPTEPHYDDELIAVYRLYARLHKHLSDYIYRYAQEAHETGHPIIRPLFYEYPEDEEAWNVWDAYLLGDDYLVAPVLTPGASSRTVYLPEGTWIDYWNPDDQHTGPTTVTVATPFHKMPIFLRSGSSEERLDLPALYDESLEIARSRPALPDGSQIVPR